MLVVAMWCLYPTTELLKKKKKKKQKQLPYFRANFVWAIIWSVLQTTPNPDSNPQAGLWVPNLWMKRAGRGLPRVMR